MDAGRYRRDGMKTGFTCRLDTILSLPLLMADKSSRGGSRSAFANARTAKAASLLDRAFQTGSPMGTLESLPSFGPGGRAGHERVGMPPSRQGNQEFLAKSRTCRSRSRRRQPEIRWLTPGGGRTGERQGSRATARPLFEPSRSTRSAPGYQGPVARRARRCRDRRELT